ncbi:MAG: glycolate oxidase subunit GlcE [Gammaproteobacteria bacterium]|nr:glycolate oxidase subunit GlcE [Gammaproteobacteria bacterium]
MTADRDTTPELVEQTIRAAESATPLNIVGGGSKSFLGRLTQAEPLHLGAHRGIVSYEPTELVVTARAGTPLVELESVLAERNQMLGFEPPHFGDTATVGGTVASGLSGPRRPFAGAARDFVLGIDVLNGRGEVLSFGGQVMKNVAGYDLSRLMTGAMGTLGVILSVSLKVLPQPRRSVTLAFELDAPGAIERLARWCATPLPVSGAYHDEGRLFLRLSGTPLGVEGAVASLGGELDDDDGRWQRLREHALPFFGDGRPLWRVSVPPAAAPPDVPGPTLIDWGGALRWLVTEASAGAVREAATRAGGHAMLFRHGERTGEVYHPLTGPMLALHRRLKHAFDPQRIFNRGRMYAEL